MCAEVFNAPKRRVDNEISRLSDSVAMLHMHCQIIGALQKQYRYAMWKHRAAIALGGE
jgi:hypothetical protein